MTAVPGARPVVYVAGPYAGDVAHNVRRAVALGRLAVATGHAPIVPHAHGHLGLYGSPSEGAPGVREAALECGVVVARMVGRDGGRLWVLLRDDATMSAGTQAEHDAYVEASGWQITAGTWTEWYARFRRADLVHVWRGAE